MPDEDRTQEKPEEVLRRLLTERDALHRRLAWVETQVAQLSLARQDALVSRLASLEEALRRLTPATSSIEQPHAAPGSPSAVVGPDFDRPAAAPALTVAVAGPASAAAQPTVQSPRSAPAQPGQTPQPRIIGEGFAAAPIALYSTPAPGAPVLGWIPRNSLLSVTEATVGERIQIVFQNRYAWVDTRGLQLEPSPAAGSRPASTTAQVAASVPQAAPNATSAIPATARSAPPPPPAQPAWSRQGFMSRLLALIGAGVTLIGVAFLLILAAQYGVFGPLARTISAAGLAVLLVGLAFLVRRRDPRNVGAPILAATGVAAGYLSVVTATVIYGWLPPLVGVVLAALIGLGGMVLARLWDNQWVALISVLGSLILAVYVGRTEPVPTAGLMVVMTGVTLWFERGTGWRIFPFSRVLPTVLFLLSLTRSSQLSSTELSWLIALTVGLALLGLVSALIAPPEPAVGQAIALGLLAPIVAPAALAPQLLSNTSAAAGVLGLVAVVYVVAGFLPMVHERVRWAAVPIGAAFAMLAVFAATGHRYLGVLTLVLATVYLAVAARTRSAVNLVVGGVLAVFGVLGWLPLLARCLDQEAASTAGPEQIAQSLVGIVVVVLAARAATRWFGVTPRWSTYLSWSMAIAMGSVAIIHSGSWIGVQAGNADAGFQAGQATVTIAWMVLCILFLQRGLAVKEEADVWLHLALAVAALAVAKLFLLDLGMLAAIARVGAFLAVGLLLLFVGTRYARAWERAHGDDPPEPSLPPGPPEPSVPTGPPVQVGTGGPPKPPESSDV